MKKNKTHSIVLSILAILFAAGAGCLLYFGVTLAYRDLGVSFIGFTKVLTERLPAAFQSLANINGILAVTWSGIPFLLIFYIVLAVLSLMLVVFWLVHFIMLLAKHRPSALFPNLCWLILGAAFIVTGFALVGMIVPTSGSTAPVLFAGIDGVVDIFSFIGHLGSLKQWLSVTLMVALLVVVIVGYFLAFSACVESMKDVVRNPGYNAKKEKELAAQNAAQYQSEKEDFEAAEKNKDKDTIISNINPADDSLRSVQYAELAPETQNVTSNKSATSTSVHLERDGNSPLIVQNISFAGQNDAPKAEPAPAPYPYPPYPYYPYAPYPYPFAPMAYPTAEPKKEEEKKEEPAPTFAEERPLTAKELRAVIREELHDHDHPEELEPLTDEQARELIKNELSAYYAGEKPITETVKEEKETVQEVPAQAPVATAADSDDYLTSDELRELVKQTVTEALKAEESEEDAEPLNLLTADEVRTVVSEELAKQPKELSVAGPSIDDIRQVVSEELEKQPKPLDGISADEVRAVVSEELEKQPKAEPAPTVDDIRQVVSDELEKQPKAVEGINADEVRTVVSEELEKQPKAEVAPSIDDIRQVVVDELEKQPKAPEALNEEQVRAVVSEELEKQPKPAEPLSEERIRELVKDALLENKEEPVDSEALLKTKETVEENKTAIAEANEKIVPSDAIRQIVAEELEKYFAGKELVLPVKEVVAEPEPAPEPVVEAAPVAEAPAEPVAEAPAPKAKIIRIPFAERMLSMDEDMKDMYNDLKAEALAYGLKSRISNSGDTFRLHTKAYVKITVAGKGLKLYLALDPNDYRNTPIPVKDVGAKNMYREIPLCFKVKSALSLKRAKQLIADAAAKDHLEKGEVQPYDYIAQLKDYHESKDEPDDDDDEE